MGSTLHVTLAATAQTHNWCQQEYNIAVVSINSYWDGIHCRCGSIQWAVRPTCRFEVPPLAGSRINNIFPPSDLVEHAKTPLSWEIQRRIDSKPVLNLSARNPGRLSLTDGAEESSSIVDKPFKCSSPNVLFLHQWVHSFFAPGWKEVWRSAGSLW